MSKADVSYEGGAYSKFRPSYSDEIYSLIYKFHDQNNGEYNIVVDVGTGTGQAAIELCKKFKRVYGIDTLTEQIENARHQYELQESDATWIKVLAAQMGVGGDDSWGAPVHDEFLLSSADSYQLSFMIEPLN